MTPRLLARLFVVPLLIVIMLVLCSVVVVLLFGWISESGEQSVDALVDQIVAGASRISTGRGEKILRVAMLPEDKELWQAAKELAARLQADDPQELPPEKKGEIAARLERVLEEVRPSEQARMGQEMQQFLLQALGHLGQASSVGLLMAYALDEAQPVGVRRSAVSGLVLMRDVPEARQSWPRLAPLLDDSEPVVRIVAAVAIGALAEPGDDLAIGALARAARSPDRELMWNATLALGKLGSPQAIPGLRDMLDRRYWEDVKLDLPDTAERGAPGLTPGLIDQYLIHALDVARQVGGDELEGAVEALTNDPSPVVRDHAQKVLDSWPSSTTSPAATSPAAAAIPGRHIADASSAGRQSAGPESGPTVPTEAAA